MHAGPAVMTLVLLRTYMPALGFIEFRNKALGLYLTMFTATALFVIPKGLLILDMIPSLELRKKEERPGVLYTPAVDSPVPPPPKEKVNGCNSSARDIFFIVVHLTQPREGGREGREGKGREGKGRDISPSQ